jgi:hypothetical protein
VRPAERLPRAEDVEGREFFRWWSIFAPEGLEDDAKIARAAWAVAWRQGGWDAIRRTTRLSELIERFEDIVGLYREVEVERARPSAYWRTEPDEQARRE